MAGASAGVDPQAILLAQLGFIAQQGVADNQRMAQFGQLAFIKDLMQGGQESTGDILASLNAADRTPVIKTA